ncbi:MAG: hypothetical protein IKZ19_04400 [Clostridia bacterium]|nr:hypothetical protein [Clostridia bacterium]
MITNFDDIRLPLDLNGEWTVRYEGPCSGSSEYRTVSIPSDVSVCFPEQPYISGVFRFRKKFIPGEEYSGRRVVLSFDAVNYSAHVYLNEKHLGYNDQGYLPFEFEITKAVRINEPNELTVLVDTRRKNGQLPTSFYWKNSGGIIRDVCIYSTKDDYISDAFVEAHADGTASVNTSIVSPAHLIQHITLKDPEGNTLFDCKDRVCSGSRSFSAQTEKVKTWSPDSPALYTAEITLENSDGIVDRKTVVYGYRDIDAKNGKLYLNGEEIFLKGFNRHEDHPACGGAASADVVCRDFETIKASGANFVRMCHYPHDQRELDLADRLGLALLVEIPLCAYMGDTFEIENSNEPPQNEEVYANACRCLERMITRDRSHPSVLIWSVSNENREPDNPNVTDNHKGLIQLAKKLDPSRLVTHVSTYSTDPNREKYFLYDDVICFNAYPSINNRIEKRCEDYDFEKSKEMIIETVAALRNTFPEKPVILTEFGYRTGIPFDSVTDEEMQTAAVTKEFEGALLSANGASVWLFADHLWPEDPRLPCKTSRYGLMTRDRIKKTAFDAFCKLLNQVP